MELFNKKIPGYFTVILLLLIITEFIITYIFNNLVSPELHHAIVIEITFVAVVSIYVLLFNSSRDTRSELVEINSDSKKGLAEIKKVLAATEIAKVEALLNNVDKELNSVFEDDIKHSVKFYRDALHEKIIHIRDKERYLYHFKKVLRDHEGLELLTVSLFSDFWTNNREGTVDKEGNKIEGNPWEQAIFEFTHAPKPGINKRIFVLTPQYNVNSPLVKKTLNYQTKELGVQAFTVSIEDVPDGCKNNCFLVFRNAPRKLAWAMSVNGFGRTDNYTFTQNQAEVENYINIYDNISKYSRQWSYQD